MKRGFAGFIIMLVLCSSFAFAATPYSSAAGYHPLQQVTTDETGTSSVDKNSDGTIDRAQNLTGTNGIASLGTSSTETKLQLKGSSSTTLWTSIEFFSGTTNTWAISRKPSNGNFLISLSGVGDAFEVTNGAAAADLKVGIGTTPVEKLDVAGNIKASGNIIGAQLCMDDTSNCKSTWSDVVQTVLTGGTADKLAKWTGTNSLGASQIVDTGSAVGIGLPNPSNKLHIKGSSTDPANLVMIDSINSNDMIGLYRDSVRKAVIGANNAAGGNNVFIYHDASGSFPLYIKGNGYVGIGDTTPTNKLDVAGAIGINDVAVIDAARNWVGNTIPITKTAAQDTTADTIADDGTITLGTETTGAYVASESDPIAKTFAKTALPTCTSGQVLKGDGTSLSCVADQGITAESDPLAKTFAKTALPTCAAGQVLKGDGTSLSCVADQGITSESDPKVAGGTANYLTKWSSANSLGNSIIIDTGSAVAIGTTVPSEKLHVQGGHGSSKIRIFSDEYLQGVGGGNTADLVLWASEPGWTWTGTGIGNNMIGSPYYGRRATNRGASYIRLLDNLIMLNTIDSSGVDRNGLTVSNGNVFTSGQVSASSFSGPGTYITGVASGLTVGTANYWDGYDTPAGWDLNAADDITTSNIASQNVNSAGFSYTVHDYYTSGRLYLYNGRLYNNWLVDSVSVNYANNAGTVGGLGTGSLLRKDTSDTMSGTLTVNGPSGTFAGKFYSPTYAVNTYLADNIYGLYTDGYVYASDGVSTAGTMTQRGGYSVCDSGNNCGSFLRKDTSDTMSGTLTVNGPSGTFAGKFYSPTYVVNTYLADNIYGLYTDGYVYASDGVSTAGPMSANTFKLANGFELQQGASNYGQFNSWVHLNGNYGLYSVNNGAHFYPNDASYGAWRISGTRNGYGGINYNGRTVLMMQDDLIGLYNEAYGKWIIYGYGSTGDTYIAPNGGNVGIGTTFVIKNSGNVGIGTTNPGGWYGNARALHVYNSAGFAESRIQGYGGGILELDSTYWQNWHIQNSYGTFTITQTGVADRFTINTGGEVTIGGPLTTNKISVGLTSNYAAIAAGIGSLYGILAQGTSYAVYGIGGSYGGLFYGTSAGISTNSCSGCSVLAEMAPVAETPTNGDVMCTNPNSGNTEICKEDKSRYLRGIAQQKAEQILRMGCAKTLDQKNGSNSMNIGVMDIEAWKKQPECEGWYPIALSGLSEETNVVCKSPNGTPLRYGDILVTSNVPGRLRPLDKEENVLAYQIAGKVDSICAPGKETDSIKVWIS